MLHFDGNQDPERRRLAEAGQVVPGPEQIALPYRKMALTYAIRVTVPFEVETIEGVMQGKAGDYLAIGTSGEMYPIDAAIFIESYARRVG